MLRFKKSFTLVELMIVIAILAILSAIVIFTLNPSRLFDNFRDTRRVTDISSIHKAINFMESWNESAINYGNSNTLYISLPDTSTTCSSYTLPTLPSGYVYSCKPASTYKNSDSTGWIPIDFTVTNGNRYLSSLPTDPINDSDYFYSYFPGGSYELIARLKNSNTDSINDNGYYDDCFELGSANRTNLTPIPKNLILNGEMESLTNWPSNLSIETTDVYEGSGSLKRVGSATVWSSNYIKVDPNKRYRLSGCFKSVGEGGLSRMYFGVQSWDKNYRQITPHLSNSIENTRTVLAEELNTGDLSVKVSNISDWVITPSYFRYLSIYPYEDYPEYTYSRNSYIYDDIDYDNSLVILRNPYSGVSRSAGTLVSQSRGDYGSYTYAVLRGTNVPNSWRCYSAEIQGDNVPVISWNQFRYATEYIKILVLANYTQDPTYSVLMDNFKLELIANE